MGTFLEDNMKIDLHIHTKQNKYLDSSFSFDQNFFRTYIEQNHFDIVAITNHNLFDLQQFKEIKNAAKDLECLILPGIELSVEKGHVVLIGDETEETYRILKEISDAVQVSETSDSFSLSVTEFNGFMNKKGLIIIPHILKKPKIEMNIISSFTNEVLAGEVDSPKHFFRFKKEHPNLSPVYFSDIRIGESTKKEDYENKSRFTYIECQDKTFKSLKNALKNPKNVSLSENNLPNQFDILNGQASAITGINVLIGKRSSGKTYTLDHISELSSKSVLYIKQFEITEDCTDDVFTKKLQNIETGRIVEYFNEFNVLLKRIDAFANTNVGLLIKEYIESLKNKADSQLQDAYSVLPLFNYKMTNSVSFQSVNTIFSSLDSLLSIDDSYKKKIDESGIRDNLINLYYFFLEEKKRISRDNKVIEIANDWHKSVSQLLGEESVAVQIKDVDLNFIYKCIYAKRLFNELVNKWTSRCLLDETMFSKFHKKIEIFRQKNRTLLKSNLGVEKGQSIDYLVDEDPFTAYCKSKNDNSIKNNGGDFSYRLFFDYKIELTNEFNSPVSGGQKAEYFLLNKLSEYKNYDMILIDEMESSFDNPFLNQEIIKKIKLISHEAIVFISTHNNNLGVSLKPDYYIYHKVKVENDNVVYEHFCGQSTGEYLVDKSKEKISIHDALMETMEAGDPAYIERKNKYETTND